MSLLCSTFNSTIGSLCSLLPALGTEFAELYVVCDALCGKLWAFTHKQAEVTVKYRQPNTWVSNFQSRDIVESMVKDRLTTSSMSVKSLWAAGVCKCKTLQDPTRSAVQASKPAHLICSCHNLGLILHRQCKSWKLEMDRSSFGSTLMYRAPLTLTSTKVAMNS